MIWFLLRPLLRKTRRGEFKADSVYVHESLAFLFNKARLLRFAVGISEKSCKAPTTSLATERFRVAPFTVLGVRGGAAR